jgi:CDP-glycerol glycerophosphotransferase (TagB/SpsB family)
LLNATHLLSSHLDRYVWGFLDTAAFSDMIRYKFVWLQHGVTQGDYSRLINHPPIDCLITSTTAEFESIVGDPSPYRYTRKETVLTGLPRHDILLSGPIEDSQTIVIMPTWRLSLTGPGLARGNKRAVNPAFYSSEFARRWKSVLQSPRLAAAIRANGYRVVFVPHPNIEPYIDFFEVPVEIEVRTFSHGQSLQNVFRQLSLFVTDFSSKAFDVAYLGKPLIYYQFDRELVQGGAHLSVPGYFDYERDGFGPVHSEEADLINAIEGFVGGGGADPIYAQRAAGAFVFRDGKCRERVLQAVLALSSPRVEPVAE